MKKALLLLFILAPIFCFRAYSMSIENKTEHSEKGYKIAKKKKRKEVQIKKKRTPIPVKNKVKPPQKKATTAGKTKSSKYYLINKFEKIKPRNSKKRRDVIIDESNTIA